MHAPQIYGCLADATRLRLLHLLSLRALCVCHFEAVLGLPQTKISRHLAHLRRHGLVTVSRRGVWRIYALARTLPPLVAANLACLREGAADRDRLRRDRARLEGLERRIDCDCAAPAVPRHRILRFARQHA